VPVKLSAVEAETAATHNIFEPMRAGHVSNFSIWADDLDIDDTPTLVLDVGIDGETATDVDEFIDGSTVGQAGTSSVSGVIDLANPGFAVVVGDYITLTIAVAADADKGAAGTVYVAFDYHVDA
jgi:hypothetical protein